MQTLLLLPRLHPRVQLDEPARRRHLHPILIPLHRLDYARFRHYELVLWVYAKLIMEQEEPLCLLLLRHLLRFWPRTSAAKKQQFLKKIVQEDEHPHQHKLLCAAAHKLLHVLQRCNHYKTICDVLGLLEMEEVQDFIERFGGQTLWCSLYQALFDVSTCFFYSETTSKTRETMAHSPIRTMSHEVR